MTMLSNYEERLIFAFGNSSIEDTLHRLRMVEKIAIHLNAKANIRKLEMKLNEAQNADIYKELVKKVVSRQQNLVRGELIIERWSYVYSELAYVELKGENENE